MKTETKTKILKISIICFCLLAIILAIYLPLKLSGTLDKISTAEDLKELILSGGVYSYLIFFVIQFLQVCLLPIPAFATTVAGALVFGPWIACLISFISIMLASIFCFFMGRKVGRKLVVWVAGESDTKKWEQKLEKGKYVFFLMMLFPVFPDDILCLVVGATTSISYKFFIITNLITRPIAIVSTCFIGSGYLIPFSGWGIPVWIALILICALVFYLSIKFEPQIEKFILKLSMKLGKKKENTQPTKTLEETKTNENCFSNEKE